MQAVRKTVEVTLCQFSPDAEECFVLLYIEIESSHWVQHGHPVVKGYNPEPWDVMGKSQIKKDTTHSSLVLVLPKFLFTLESTDLCKRVRKSSVLH